MTLNKMKRSEVTLERKFKYLAMAIDELERRSEGTVWKTDLIGLACQFSVNPKLKRQDFNDLINLSIKDIIQMVSEGRNIKKIQKPDEDNSPENCKHYDECQGRHKCCSPDVNNHQCWGICEFYEEEM